MVDAGIGDCAPHRIKRLQFGRGRQQLQIVIGGRPVEKINHRDVAVVVFFVKAGEPIDAGRQLRLIGRPGRGDSGVKSEGEYGQRSGSSGQ